MVSKRQQKLQRELRQYLGDAYENFCQGVLAQFGKDPRQLAEATHVKTAFSDTCAVFEWVRLIRRRGQAGFLLVEMRSTLPLVTALAAIGFYEAAALQLRYVIECFFGFLYFRDHPRELEFAERGDDQWELTRPSVVVKYLRKLPEYNHTIGHDLLNELWTLYSDLSTFAHPRKKSAMGLRGFLTEAAPDKRKAALHAKSVRSLACGVSGLFRLSEESAFARASELSREAVKRPIKATYHRRIEKQVTLLTSGV